MQWKKGKRKRSLAYSFLKDPNIGSNQNKLNHLHHAHNLLSFRIKSIKNIITHQLMSINLAKRALMSLISTNNRWVMEAKKAMMLDWVLTLEHLGIIDVGD